MHYQERWEVEIEMKRFSLFLLAGGLALAVLPAMKADPVKKATTITFSQPIEIPGMVLEPGTYVMKVPDPYTHQWEVGFYNRNESHLYKLVRTVPAYRPVLNNDGKTVITFEERAAGAPRAIDKWYFPGDYYGREFVYPKAETISLAENTPPAALAPAPAPPPAVTETQPQAEAAQPEPQPEQPQELAQAAPPPPPPAEQAAPAPESEATPAPQELPKTGSSLPLIFGAGSFLALAGLMLRVRS